MAHGYAEKKKRRPWRRIVLFVVVGTVAAALLRMEWPTTLQFQDLTDPRGFRELILDTERSSRGAAFDPLVRLESIKPTTEENRISDVCDALFQQAGDPRLGSSEAPIKIVEFFDYQCPYCRIVAKFLPEIQAEENQVQIIYKEWPIFGESSELAARYALAANGSGAYQAYHERLMASRGIPTRGTLADIAERVGLDPVSLAINQEDKRFDDIIMLNSKLARQLRFRGTPSFVVGRTLVEGAVTKQQLQQLIDVELDETGTHPCG